MEPRSGSVRRETSQKLTAEFEDPEDDEQKLYMLQYEKARDSPQDHDEKAQNSMQDYHATLCQSMRDPDDVRRKLFSCKVITEGENQEAQRVNLIPSEKSEKIVDCVRKLGFNDIIMFAAVLRVTANQELAEILVQSLEQQLEEHSVDVREKVDLARKEMLKLCHKVNPAHQKPDYTYYLAELDDEHADLLEAVEDVLSHAKPKRLNTRLIALLGSYKDRASELDDIGSAIKKIQQCFQDRDPESMFMYIEPFLDKLDVRLLEGLIKFASKDDSSAKYAAEQKIDLDQQLDVYKSKVVDACEKTLESCPRRPASKRPKNEITMGIQTSLPEHDVTIDKICSLNKFLCGQLGMPETCFEGFSCSNVTLFFSVSRDRLPFLVHWCFLHRRDLMEKFSVELVFSPGHFVYNLYADQEYPYPQVILPQPQPVVPEKVPVVALSAMETKFTAVLKDSIWEWQTAFEQKNEKWQSELHAKIGEVQQAILSAGLSQPQPVVPEKEPVNILSEMEKSLADTLQRAIWNGQKAFEKKNDQFKSELQFKIGEVQLAILSIAKPDEQNYSEIKQINQQLADLSSLEASKRKKSHSDLGLESPVAVKWMENLHGKLDEILRKVSHLQPSSASKKGPYANKVGIIMTSLLRTAKVFFRSFKAHHGDNKFHYHLVVAGKQEFTDKISNVDILVENVSDALEKILQSSESPMIILEARFGHLFWKTNHPIRTDCKYPIHQLERNGEIDVSRILFTKFTTFETICDRPSPGVPSSVDPLQEQLGLTRLGQTDAVVVTFTLCAPHKDSFHYVVSSNVLSDGRCQFVRVNPQTKEKEFAFDCVPLLGNLDFRISLSSAVPLSDDNNKTSLLTEIGTDLAKHMSLKSHEVVFDEPPLRFRVTYMRHTKKQLYLMTHEGQSYIFAECEVENCLVSSTDLPEGSVVYPLTDCHRELELWNCQWQADFFQLEGKDWREYFASNGCDVSMIQLSPRPVQVDNIVRELGAYVRCALKIAEVA